MCEVVFFVWGQARPQGSKKAFILKGKNGGPARAILTESSKGLKTWRGDVRSAAQEAMEQTGAKGWFENEPLVLAVSFEYLRPKSIKKTILEKVTQPDVSKLIRGVEDALTGLVFGDDRQLVKIEAEKRYGSRPGALVTVRRKGANE